MNIAETGASNPPTDSLPACVRGFAVANIKHPIHNPAFFLLTCVILTSSF
jgi:hypothetical protein